MFKSYEYLDYCGPKFKNNNKQRLCKFRYKIIDNEFEEETIVEIKVEAKSVSEVEAEVAIAVIDVYERRNLNVAANLVLAFKYMESECVNNIYCIIKENKRYNPKYLKYAKEVEKYLTWI